MKTRLTCQLARIGSALRDRAPSSHLATCPACQAYLARTTTLDADLRRDAHASASPAPSDLDRRILEAVAYSRASTLEPTRRRTWLPAATLVSAAAAIAIAFTVLRRPTAEPLVTRADADALVQAVGGLSTQLVDHVLPTTGTLIAENPLQHELTAVYTDARTALDFLALNFLPRASVSAADPTLPRTNRG